MRVTWLDIIKEAFGSIGTELCLADIYKRVLEVCENNYPERIIPESYDAIIRNCIETHSESSDAFVSDHCFESVYGKGHGFWRRVK